jgi:hypothetical protein
MSKQNGAAMTDEHMIRIRNDLGPEAEERAAEILRRRADARLRRLARNVGLRVRCKQGRYAILGAFSDSEMVDNSYPLRQHSNGSRSLCNGSPLPCQHERAR